MKFDITQILIVLIGILGTLSGIFISEYFRRKNREALFSDVIFKKRLNIYEELFKRLNIIRSQAGKVMEGRDLSKKKRHQIWSEVVLPFAEFLDNNDLYINEKIQDHAIASIIGVEEIADFQPKEKEQRILQFQEDISKAIEMIREDSGLKRLDKFFKKINKPSLNSDWINYIEKLKK